MIYNVSHIARILDGNATVASDVVIEHLIFDSRKIYSPSTSLFFALKGSRRNGHQFIPELYKKGVRNFVVSETTNPTLYPEANIIKVENTLTALQKLAAHHRKQFNIPVIGITGSNGKTIVKEWLYQLLQEDYNIVRSPKSFNSQIGVPLSVWQMNRQHTLGIFEAGISQPDEMENLKNIIQPTIGILTNIGEAHSEGFESADQKVEEKIRLFDKVTLVIYCTDEWIAEKAIVWKHENCFHKTGKYPFRIFSWGRMQKSTLQILVIRKKQFTTQVIAFYRENEISITVPFTDDASIHNAITCWCVLLHLGLKDGVIAKRMELLQPVNMRLELKKGINNCTIINDSYSADLSSLHIALDFLQQQSLGLKKTVILSDFFQTSLDKEELYSQIAADLVQHNVDRVIGVGLGITENLNFESFFSGVPEKVEFYISTEDFISRVRFSDFKEETILVKGARVFKFEQIIQLLEQKVHQTVLEINLNAIVHNLKQYQQLLQPSIKMMAMVKAFAYGSGGAEIANMLQYHKVDYLAVAYADEGVELRKTGINMPIMVMNAEEATFDTLVNYNLEPDIYSFGVLHSFDAFLKQEGLQHYPVHIELETGMNRLGFPTENVNILCEYLKITPSFKIQSVFSHLASSEEAKHDKFTREQYENFAKACEFIKKETGYKFISHISNSAAIIRYPEMHMDMVRLGIGLYGIDNSSSGKLDLQPVATLKSTIAQIKNLKKGESVSYNRSGMVKRDSVIATVRIGYADGYSRRMSNGFGKMMVRGKLVPVIGSVCMDMTMIDVTDVPGLREGDEVIIFGKELPIQQLAEIAGTIPYEIMTGISQRVKRVYFEE